MIIILQLILYCLIFTGVIAFAVRGGAINGIYFYPKPVQERAFFQAVLFLEVMNLYDGIVIDKIWVGHSKFWIIPGTEDLPFVPTWKQVLKKRGILTLIWPVGAAIVAGVIVLIFWQKA